MSDATISMRRIGQHALAAVHVGEVVDERLDGHHAGVLPVGVGDLARQRLGDACGLRDGLPPMRADLSKPPLELAEDGGVFFVHGHTVIPNGGSVAIPRYGSRVLADFRDMRPRDILRKNFLALRRATPALNRLPDITKAGGGANGTLGRIQKADVAVGVDYLEPLARTFGIEPWQLLHPCLTVEPDKSAKPKVSVEVPAWPFSSELASAIGALGGPQRARLEGVIRAHLGIDTDNRAALSYDVSAATVLGPSSATQATPPAPPALARENARRPGDTQDGRSKGNRPSRGRS